MIHGIPTSKGSFNSSSLCEHFLRFRKHNNPENNFKVFSKNYNNLKKVDELTLKKKKYLYNDNDFIKKNETKYIQLVHVY